MAQRIQLRRGTAAEWSAANPVLAVGEPGVETDTGKQKFGDGVTAWNARPYASKGDTGPVGPPNTDASLLSTGTVPEGRLPARLSDSQLTATYGRNTLVWSPPSGLSGVTNRTSLQAAVDAAIAAGNDLLMNAKGTFDIDGTVNVTGKVRIFGLGRDVTTVHQVTKPLPTFYVNAQGVTFEDFTGTGDGPSFTMGVATFQNYNVIRIERGSHNFTARRLGFANHYIGLMFRNYPNDPLTGVTTPPVKTNNVIVDDIYAVGVWAAMHGGPFNSLYLNNVRGSTVRATGHPDTDGHAPHLVYINAPTPADGNRTDDYYSRGGVISNLEAWDGPDYVGAAFSFKYMRGASISQLNACNYRGIIEFAGMEDNTVKHVVSTLDKYPALGSDATRASISLNTSLRNDIEGVLIDFAATDHGKAYRTENGSSDNIINNLKIVERGTIDRSTGTDLSFPVYMQGDRNTVKNVTITNLGANRYKAIAIAATGSKNRLINPTITGKYATLIGVDAGHLDATVDYDPTYLSPDRTVSSVKLVVQSGARTVIRDRGVGQVLPAGFVDEFERGVTVAGLVASDDGKTWQYRDSGNPGNPLSWQANADGTAKFVGAGARAIAMVDGVSANGTLKTTIGTMAVSNSSGLAARATDWNNYIGLLFNYGAGDNKLQLVKRVAGSSTFVAASTAAPLAADAVVELVLNGTAVSVKVNGTEVISPQTITDFPTVTTHGMLGSAAETALTWKRAEFVPA